MNSFLLEVGTEEIPAGYIQPALSALAAGLARQLEHARIAHGSISAFGTPRRLAVLVRDVAERQAETTEDVLGPPERVAYDEKGQPTLAARKFAEKLGIGIGRLKVRETEKGRYVSGTITDKGLATARILPQILPDLILSVPFPKTMRWSDLNIAFARPIQSITALLGSSVVRFTLGNRIKSGRASWGHMFMQHEKISIGDADDYLDEMRRVRVVADVAERREMVRTQIAAAAEAMGGRVLPDEALVDIVTNLVEFPVATGGWFDEAFLELPREILITAMREHQKYFAVVNGEGRLMPCFIAVNNTLPKDMALVTRGHQRVLRARLSDARFFYQSDLQDNMEDWVERLKRVLFQAQLGSMHDKARRIEALGSFLAQTAAPECKEHVVRAARLCKADLVSQVVYEFANLQGIMGRIYAQHAGEEAEVAAAIEEHYRPTYSGGPLPETRTGAVLSIADKLDTICGCFSVGLVPTGASDPYALRRQSIGIVQTMIARNFGFSLREAVEAALKPFPTADPGATADAVMSFIQSRITHILAEEGYAKDIIAAVVGVSVENIPDVWRRTAALHKLKSADGFEPLAAAFKRIVNILRKAELQPGAVPDTGCFEQPAESALMEAYRSVQRDVQEARARGDLDTALSAIAMLRQPVDRFFDDVLVMAEDPAVRRNRLALLQAIASLFNRIADFTKIS